MPGSSPERTQHMREIGKAGVRARQVAAVERRIRELVEASPPLTSEQRDRLAVLLRSDAA